MWYSNSINFNRFKLSYLWRTFTLLSIYYLNLFNVTFNLYLMQWFPNQLNWIKYICITHNNLWSQLLITFNKFIIYNPKITIYYIYGLINSIFPFRFSCTKFITKCIYSIPTSWNSIFTIQSFPYSLLLLTHHHCIYCLLLI